MLQTIKVGERIVLRLLRITESLEFGCWRMQFSFLADQRITLELLRFEIVSQNRHPNPYYGDP